MTYLSWDEGRAGVLEWYTPSPMTGTRQPKHDGLLRLWRIPE